MTLQSAFQNALNASRVTVGVAQQTSDDQFSDPYDVDCFDGYCALVGTHECELRRGQVRGFGGGGVACVGLV